jgi:signal transduction histidine kinase
LNHESQIQSTNGFIGRQLAELDISLLYNETWESALDKLDSAQRFSQDDIAGTGTEVREVVAVVGKPCSEGRSRHFRVLISSLAGRDETSHVLSFEFVYVTSLNDGLEFIGDAGRIRQVLSNLLMNALKFTDKGVVKISVSGTKLEPKRDDHEAMQVKFVIEDTGIGIEKHVLKGLFTPFHQGDASTARLYGGTGLGLTISQNVRGLFVIICLSFSS